MAMATTGPGKPSPENQSAEKQSAENSRYVRTLLRLREPGFSAALELAVELELAKARRNRGAGSERRGRAPVLAARCKFWNCRSRESRGRMRY